jgi:2-succinyl-5-enolpyruvyl-6-hydroxy-3-cyclohexene-1-carboxylate synthase
MLTNATHVNEIWATLMVEELVRSGVDRFCLAPGSRCTPLTYAIAQHPAAHTVVHHDERGAAFCALGMGKATVAPAVVVTTSGTAVANCMPAVVEAAMSNTPLIIVSADRPPELLDTGANQTIDQVKIFGDYARWHAILPCPDAAVRPSVVLTTIDQAVHRSKSDGGGPVHLNCMYREPLAPNGNPTSFAAYLSDVAAWQSARSPYTTYNAPAKHPGEDACRALGRLVQGARRPLLLVGALADESDIAAVRACAGALQWPLLADVCSGLRLSEDAAYAVTHYDQILLADAGKEALQPDLVIHVGGPVTSKRLLEHLESDAPPAYVRVADHPLRHDPNHRVSLRIEADTSAFCECLAKAERGEPDAAWCETLHRLSDTVATTMRDSDLTHAIEISTARIIAERIASDHRLVLGSSMPIRDMDMYAASGAAAPVVTANRGASGIDGTIATAVGVAHATGQPVTAVIGDVAALHDLNSFGLLAQCAVPVTLVIINNDGGGIFSFLPVAKHASVFDEYFGTPHGLTFAQAAAMYGLPYLQPDSPTAFATAYTAGINGSVSNAIEVTSDRAANSTQHRALQAAIHAALDAKD